MDQILEDFRPFKDVWGLIQPAVGGSSGNGLRYTSEYLFSLLEHGSITLEEEEAITRAIDSCEYGEQIGVLFRTPENKDQNAPDDYVAIIAISAFLKDNRASMYPRRFIIHWDMYDGVFQNNGGIDNPSAWFWRMPHLLVHAKFAAGFYIDLWSMLPWVWAVLQSAFSKKQDNKILGWYLLRAAKGKSKIADKLFSFWSWMLKRHYEGGIGHVLREYFGFEHPSAKYLLGVFQ